MHSAVTTDCLCNLIAPVWCVLSLRYPMHHNPATIAEMIPQCNVEITERFASKEEIMQPSEVGTEESFFFDFQISENY